MHFQKLAAIGYIQCGLLLMRAWIFLTLFSVLLLSCASLRDSAWPENIPPVEFFESAYQADPLNQQLQTRQAYLEWIISFYHGNLLYPTGWLDIEAAILHNVPLSERQQQAAQLQRLGARIAADWAKHNDLRLLDNRLLSLWGSMLQLAPDEQQLSVYIEAISADIDSVLTQTLDPGAINPRRYEESMQIELFDDF